MVKGCIQVSDEKFAVDGRNIVLKGFGVGSWMNLEHFMIGIPGTEHMIIKAFEDVFGRADADMFFDNFLLNFMTEADFCFLKALGVNVLRLPVNYHYFMDDQAPGRYLEKGFKYLDKVVGLGEKHGIYTIIDLHSVPGGQNPDWHSDNGTGQALFWKYAALREQVTGLWEFIAGHYRDNPWIAGYDLLNEPFPIPDGAVLNDFYHKTISAIRKVDKNHIIFLEGDHFAMDFSMLSRHEDPQVAYSFHYYPGVWNPGVLEKSMDFSERKRLFKEAFLSQLATLERFHRPIWCGEAGYVLNAEDIDFYVELTGHMLELCEENGVSWTLWAYKDAQAMGIVFPRDDTPWMRLAGAFKKEWTLPGEMEAADSALELLEKTYFKRIDPQLKYILQFRLRTLFHAVYIEEIVKPGLKRLTKEELLSLPRAFLFENCDCWDQMAALIKKFT